MDLPETADETKVVGGEAYAFGGRRYKPGSIKTALPAVQ
jgi:hypothetical protein